MSWAWSQLQKSGPAKTGPAGPLATALHIGTPGTSPIVSQVSHRMGWTFGIKLAHVVHLGPVPSYPKCPMVQWDGIDIHLGIVVGFSWYNGTI